jgi:hypothetical protein
MKIYNLATLERMSKNKNIQGPGGVVRRHRLRLPPGRLELWVVGSNPAGVYMAGVKKTFIRKNRSIQAQFINSSTFIHISLPTQFSN